MSPESNEVDSGSRDNEENLDDLESAEGVADGGRPGPASAYALNWRTVLAVDAGMGLTVLVAGIWLTIQWNPVGGGFIASLGLAYLLLVAKRGRDWAELRRSAGLSAHRR